MTGKRTYTMSPEAIEQRRQAAQKSTGPVTEEGKAISSRNAWRHGMYSAHAKHHLTLFAGNGIIFGKPCQRTCPKHPENENAPAVPCSLVENGLTGVGGDCLDKETYITVFDALMRGMQTGELDDLHSVLAANVAGAIEILQQLRDEIAAHGVTRDIPYVTKDGDLVYDRDDNIVAGKIIANPALAPYILMLDKLGLSLTELLATPRAAAQAKTDGDKANALDAFLGQVLGAGNSLPDRDAIDGERAD